MLSTCFSPTRRPKPGTLLLCLAVLAGGAGVRAQEVSFLAGGGSLPNLHSSSYSWDLDYRQHVYQYLSGSVGWINEGHITGHHRDGTAGELWLDVPLFKGRYAIAAGAGAYYYFDTQPAGPRDSADIHGTAPILSFSATAYISDRWFARFLVNRINPSSDFRSNTALFGVGYWFGQEKHPTPGELGGKPGDAAFVTSNELTAYGGESVVNASFSGHGQAYAAEYRRGLMRHLDGTLSYIYEGDPKLVRRAGAGLQLWPVNTFFDQKISVGIGLGAYIYIDNKHLAGRTNIGFPVGASVNTPALAPLVSPTFAVRISDHWIVRAVWDRVVTNYNRDSDVFLLGAGYRWE
ncbi:MAG TPA: hypothetical protein VG838_11135 [Opitutaceae bacterium]|nr:hypothetical protein [Opitutaceae bacterium]